MALCVVRSLETGERLGVDAGQSRHRRVLGVQRSARVPDADLGRWRPTALEVVRSRGSLTKRITLITEGDERWGR